MTTWQEDYQQNMLPVFGVPARMLTRGDGAYVYDTEGKQYLDFLAGIAVNALGHAHPALVRTISEQAAKLIHVSNLFASEPQVALAEKLLKLAGNPVNGKVFFANSGAEANEAAFKIARANRGADGKRTRILALDNSFHGRTMGSLSMTSKQKYREPFNPMPAGAEFIDATLEALEAAWDDNIAAIIVEPIQGEAGVLPLPEGFLALARELTSRTDALLIVDEIQTGVARTGSWFAFQKSGITPDVFTLAKGLAGGVPIGAVVTAGAASSLLHQGDHGTTFGGNPLATAAALTVLETIENDNLLQNIADQSALLRAELQKISQVVSVRGAGLLLGVELKDAVAPQVVAEALNHGLIINATDPKTIRLAPPLIITSSQVGEFIDKFQATLAAV